MGTGRIQGTTGTSTEVMAGQTDPMGFEPELRKKGSRLSLTWDSCAASPADPIGQVPLQWEGKDPVSFTVRIVHLPRTSAAEVKGGSLGTLQNATEWKANWSSP